MAERETTSSTRDIKYSQAHVTKNEDETMRLGEEFSRYLSAGDIVALFGDLGSGKTRFIKGICRGLGAGNHVSSPTFTIVHEYTDGKLPVYHFDFYRIRSLREIGDLGFEEYAESGGICLIEWAENAEAVLPAERYEVHIERGENETQRIIRIDHRLGVSAW
jgi:tRNA threonylcarbamoyladenosine biosynthesis protein TsaE